jgi:hypothetical protein
MVSSDPKTEKHNDELGNGYFNVSVLEREPRGGDLARFVGLKVYNSSVLLASLTSFMVPNYDYSVLLVFS